MLDADQRLSAFERFVRHRSRGLRKGSYLFTDQRLLALGDQFLKSTSWPDADTPEQLVKRLRARRAQKGGKTRSARVALRKKLEAEQAHGKNQLNLFPEAAP